MTAPADLVSVVSVLSIFIVPLVMPFVKYPLDPLCVFGTKMWIEGYGEAEDLDTGGVIKGKTIDVYFPSHQQALEWGRKRVAIKILQEVDSPK